MSKFGLAWNEIPENDDWWLEIPERHHLFNFSVYSFEDAIETGLYEADKNSWFVDGYPGHNQTGDFYVKNFETGEIKRFEVNTDFEPQFYWSEVN